jgi:ABC-type glycerol-3-phosphate transport system permease component
VRAPRELLREPVLEADEAPDLALAPRDFRLALPVPPEVTLDNYRIVLGLVRFHAESQAGKILASMWNSLVVALVVTVVNLAVGTTAGYA